MSEQKFAEFRERAEHVVTPANPDTLLRRGRALRRRRHVGTGRGRGRHRGGRLRDPHLQR